MEHTERTGMRRALFAGAGFVLMLLAPLQLGAQSYDPRTIAALPSYCIHTQVYRDKVPGGNNPQAISRWYEVMGGGFNHMHHYCWGLAATNHALFSSRDPRDRQFSLNWAIGQYEYVVENAGPNFRLLPEIRTKMGENMVRVGKGPLAVTQFQLAIDLRPDYWPPSVALSDYYKSMGNLKLAREVLEKALAATPNSKTLQERLAELDAGKGKPRTAAQPSEKPPARKPAAEKTATPPEPRPAEARAPTGR